LWLALSACTSILLLAITNQLTQEVAVIPFLWVLPLCIYLLSFTITFSGEKWYRRNPSIALLGIATLLLSYVVFYFESMGIVLQIGIYSFFLLLAAIICHGELYRLRPEPNRLTSFYFLVSLGGAIGGLFVSFLSPLIFNGYWELQVGVLFCWLLILIVLLKDKQSIFHTRWIWAAAPLILLVVGITGFVFVTKISSLVRGVLEMDRNFYGAYRVRTIFTGDPPQEAVSLSHGITSHGFQFVQPERRSIPTAYYGRKSGIGITLTYYPLLVRRARPEGTFKLGIVGLGTGTLAAYGKEGDYFRFYEINPDIIDLALGEGGYFTFLQDTNAVFDIVPGDARLSMEQELEEGRPQNFDVLAVDAFNSDAIPVHLLTAEAFAVYLSHLNPDGILALHISNRYLDLAPLVQKQAELNGLELALIPGPGDDSGSYASVWVLLSRNEAFFQIPDIRYNKRELPEVSESMHVWTDDYSNLLQFLRLNVSLKIR
jgi:hypothetical protein